MEEKVMKEKKGSFFYSLKSVFWAMLGVRANKGYDEDVKKITPRQAIIAGLIGVAVFITTLILVVSFVMSKTTG
jgi:amino acid transporter